MMINQYFHETGEAIFRYVVSNTMGQYWREYKRLANTLMQIFCKQRYRNNLVFCSSTQDFRI